MAVSPLAGSLAKTIGKAMSKLFLDATLTRDVPGVIVDPSDPSPPTQAIYTCKAIEQEYGAMDRAMGLVTEYDIQALILATSFKDVNGVTANITPLPQDRITIRGRMLTIVAGGSGGNPPVKSDPARATWLCRCRT